MRVTHLLPAVALVAPAVLAPAVVSSEEQSAFGRCIRVYAETKPYPTDVTVCTP